MKKLLVFAAILSFCTTETYGFWKGIGNVLNTAAQQLNPNMQQPGTQMQYNPYGTSVTTAAQQNAGNFLNSAAAGIQQYGNQAATGIQQYGNQALNFTGNLQQNAGNLLNNVATGIQQYGNQMQYNTGMMGTQVNTPVIIEALQKMYTQVAQLQNNYVTNINIVNLTSKLGNTLLSCQQFPNQVWDKLPIICQYIVNIYNILNQIGAGSQIENLADGFSDLFYTCLGINPGQ
ncbi:MAG: hypothetical protein J6T29_00570 [Alphaproteobacteria bacterium]|nr:hypothetical protein [Alphaproteobacteria bacterium]